MRLTSSTGIAKPMPALAPLGLAIWVLTPIRRPAESSSGPPELPGLMAASAVERFDLAVERAHDAHRQRLVEAEGVADGVHALAHLQFAAGADGNRRQLGRWRVDLQHRQVAVGKRAHQLGGVAGLVGQRHARRAAALDDVEVGDDVALVVPHEAGAGAARHLHHVHAEHVALRLQRGDVHHRGRDALEEIDVGLLVGGQWPARHDRARWGGFVGAAFDAGRRDQQGDGGQRHAAGKGEGVHGAVI
jgi:hypothetical protein